MNPQLIGMLLAVMLTAASLVIALPYADHRIKAQTADTGLLQQVVAGARSSSTLGNATVAFAPNASSGTTVTITNAQSQSSTVYFPDQITINGLTSGTITMTSDGNATLQGAPGSSFSVVAGNATYTLNMAPFSIVTPVPQSTG
jgi:hypothetical protein